MTTHVSASPRELSPQANRTTRTNTILDALTQRAQSILNDESLDAESRAILRQAMEINDPLLAKLVKRAESSIDPNAFSETSEDNQGSSKEKIEALADMICSAGEEPTAALFVLMSTLQNAADPIALAHSVKHLAFTRCGEFNFRGMVDTQVAVLESELFAASASKT